MKKRFVFSETSLSGLFLAKRKPVADDRGQFTRLYCLDEFKEIDFDISLSQINYSTTVEKGSVRGFHFQYPPYTESKIITCISGKVMDVSIDIRKDSSTFLKYHSEVLSDNNNSSICIPDGFAHGFQVLSDKCQLLYLHSTKYNSGARGVINILDPMVSVDWPLGIAKISDLDMNQPMLDINFKGI
jgi:dTDP-4-dehydrorhamnose 3,5-epimerase